MENNESFYKNLKPLEKFIDALDIKNQEPVPEDWHVIVTDVINSTIAIEDGRYKDVNIAGGITAMAISNSFKDMDFPFIFGGDGVTFLIPDKYISEIKDILFDAKTKIQEMFNLNLRVGTVPIKTLYENNYSVTISKYKVSKYYNQVIIGGNGIDYAEDLIKQKIENNPYLISTKVNKEIEADFSGFTCRWQDIPSSKDETISTIIKIKPNISGENLLKNILNKMEDIFGDESNYHPVTTDNLKLDNGKYIKKEALVHSKNNNILKTLNLYKIKFEMFATGLALKYNIPLKYKWYKLNKLKEFQNISSDYRKFDGTIKMVISCNKNNRIEWETYLEKLYKENSIFYGIHISNRALITCLLHSDSTREVHFIDSADGGYAIAAKTLKKQIKKVKYN